MKYAYILAFVALAIIQWIIPGRLMWQKDVVLKKGVAYKFKTQPVDPNHPFKGKYIVLNFAENSFTDTVQRGLEAKDPVFVLLSKDNHGFAFINGLSAVQPQNTDAYVKATVYYTSVEHDSITVFLEYPFTEFYMQEFKAPRAEAIYFESATDSSKITYARVRILKGDAVIEDVYINDVPIRNLIKD